MTIRLLGERDAEAFLSLRKQINEETSFMLREPDENAMLAQQQLEQFRCQSSQDSLLILVAEHGEQLVGFLIGERGVRQRNRQRLGLMIGILQAFTGQGMGTQLFMAMEDWARRQGILRLELTVMTANQAAVALYQKCGFEIEGTMRRTMLIDGAYIDEYIMAKLLH
ncbi:GNAT family N-acetyltransferase [Ktedonobacter racemifer]|uniref:GCN5-related N-acetyltransferase n=1 Tax=Ktedonobacter racemifer DSM 44963 TaxID=485913 RepID=D6U874_KTERA|nr:GNAT family protein [Ktedonobacter racemifer]EFH80085.1 GCN5-related N-acetyltransferase [Ktedonobacter racemifer DSM 44963]